MPAFFANSQNRQVGVIAVYLRTAVSVVEREHTLALEYESIRMKLKEVNLQDSEFQVVCRPPNMLSAADESLLSLVKGAVIHQEVLIIDDFTKLVIDWENLTVEEAPTS
ncbi:unnamed protein product [Dibothriocephalus latus]|uniref:Uncharacterized protein n=1 Tax=Dibothriocephalus latus TaxID=60516 RepID=A0A3P7LV82_DIBLA|nr:unnamed protein product [Dibothriocephalus latus]